MNDIAVIPARDSAIADLVAAGLSEANAKAAVTAIAKGQVRHVRVTY